MENSIKAVYMAAGVLIGVLILTTFVFVFRKGGQLLETVDSRKVAEDVAAYNSKLVIYNRQGIDDDSDGDIDDNYNTIFDVVTAWNLAYDINEENLHDMKNCLEIYIDLNKDGSYEYQLSYENNCNKGYVNATEKLTDLIKMYGKVEDSTYNDYEYKFKGKTEYDDSTGKINKIIFEKE